jgi:phosphopantothenoylcysteine decarboxylase/phosphopantothenate--cysteine ligase
LSHPSLDIVGEYSKSLEGKCVLLGVTGSVAIYRSIDTARWLMRRAAKVRVVLTRPAAELVAPKMWEWATGLPPVTELTGEVEHISLARECDSMLVAPATLSTISKIAYGIVDNPVALTAVSMRSLGKPVVIAPAMHGNMADSHQYRRAIVELERMGYVIIPPRLEKGVAKYQDPRLIARIVSSLTLHGRDMEGLSVLVTAGPTREWLDPVRFISNPSSGLMGLEAALEAYARGARVTLVHGPMHLDIPSFLHAVRVETTEDMAKAVGDLTSTEHYDIMVAAAAPVDFRPSERMPRKIRSGAELTLTLKPTPKVVGSLSRRPRVLVIFAAETVESLEELEASAMEKLGRYNADLIVANVVGVPGLGFASLKETGVILGRGLKRVFRDLLKEELASQIFDLALDILRGSRGGEGNAG